MKHRWIFYLRVLCFLFAVTAAGVSLSHQAVAQSLWGTEWNIVRGVVIYPGERYVSNLRVTLCAPGGRDCSQVADVRSDGRFELSITGRNQSHYEAHVLDSRNQLLHRSIVLASTLHELEIRLPEPQVEQPAPGVIHLRDMGPPPSSRARRLLLRAQRAAARGEARRAIRLLQKAIEVQPDYLEAHCNLGVRHMHLGEIEKAIAAFESALTIRRDSPTANLNLAVALQFRNEFAKSAVAARRALESDPGNPKASYALATALFNLQSDRDEALALFRQASREIPRARVFAALLLAQSGKHGEAREELARFHAVASPEQKRPVNDVLRQAETVLSLTAPQPEP